MKRQTRLLLYGVGTAILLISLVFVGSRIAENWTAVRGTQVHSFALLGGCVFFYAISHFSTALSWPLAVQQLGTTISLRDGVRIGLVAQIGKYLPGNFAHYLGRGALATQVGVPIKSSGISTGIELASALSAVMLVAAASLLIDPRPVAFFPAISTPALVIVAAALLGLAAISFWLVRRGVHLVLIIGPTLFLGVSFTLSGLSIYVLTLALGLTSLPIAVAIGAFALAWGAGFIVPGAPAGLGVREATLLALLSPFVGEGPAIAIAILHRLITAAVDVAAALLGYAWTAAGSRSKK